MFHEGSISGRYSFKDAAEPGRGCKPVPGVTGEYHSAIPAWDEGYDRQGTHLFKKAYHARHISEYLTRLIPVLRFADNGLILTNNQDRDHHPERHSLTVRR